MNVIRVIIGLLLLPCCAAVSRAVYFMVAGTGNCGETGGATFWLGIGAGLVLWVVVFVFLPAPVKSYVLAHELTHALWGYLMGASLLGMRVSKSGGNVKLSESNFIIVLAPYFFPLYTVLVVGAYFFASVFIDLQTYFPVFLAVTGFTLGFHIFFTVSALGQRQADIEQYGRFFSYTLIYFMNLLVIGLLLVLVSPVTISQFAARLAFDFMNVWNLIWSWLLRLYGVVYSLCFRWTIGFTDVSLDFSQANMACEKSTSAAMYCCGSFDVALSHRAQG